MTAQATTPDCDQQASATKEDPDLTVVASTVTDASDSEDLLLTVTTRYRQVQRELAKQVGPVVGNLHGPKILHAARLYYGVGDTAFSQKR